MARRYAALRGEEGEPPDPVQAFYDDPDSGPPPDWEQESWETLTARAEADAAEYEALTARLTAAGYSESAHVRGAPPVPGSPEGPAAGFGQGRPLDGAAPSTVVSGLADEATGEDRAFKDVTDDQLMGLIGGAAAAHLTAALGAADRGRGVHPPPPPPRRPRQAAARRDAGGGQ